MRGQMSSQADSVRLVQVRFLGIESIDLASYHIYPNAGPYEFPIVESQVSLAPPGTQAITDAALSSACMSQAHVPL